MVFKVFTVLMLISSLMSSVSSERLHEQIYSAIEGSAACFRRLNGTHQAGCSSSDSGAVGIVQMINDITDVQWVIKNATTGPYMAVVSTALFNNIIELCMKEPKNIAGILLYDNITNSASEFSHDTRCPNEYSAAPDSTCSSSVAGGIVWNEKGTGLLRRDIPFPIFYLPKSKYSEIKKIETCYQKYNVDKSNHQGRPLCSLQMHSFMFAAVNSELCLRRSASTSTSLTLTKVCDPLGDNNVYYSLFPRTKEATTKPVTLVTARIDSASLFDGVSPGAASSVVGMVTLLAAATTLSQMIPKSDAQLYDENILWTLFNGESFDYIGSQRVAYDIKNNAWPPSAPLSPNDIHLHVELGQIGGALASHKDDNTWPFHVFMPVYNGVKPEIVEFIEEMSSNAKQYGITINQLSTGNLPPSSLHSFRRVFSNGTNFGELLLADHDETFSNMYYQSALDQFDKIEFVYHNISVDTNGTFLSTNYLLANGTMKDSDMQVKIARLATALSLTLYQRVAGKAYTGNVTTSAHLVDEMLYCFLQNEVCRLIMAADYANSGDETPPEKVAPLYVGVTSSGTPAPVFAGHLLALLTGSQLNVSRSDCETLVTPGLSYFWLNGWNHSGVCVETTMNISAAVSPAFIIPEYDMKSGEYSSWTESVWLSLWVRVFVSASGGGAAAAGGAGLVATALAALLTGWLHRHANVIFRTPMPARLPDDAAAGILRTVNC